MDRLLAARENQKRSASSDDNTPSRPTSSARQSGHRTLGAALLALADVIGLNRHDPRRTNHTWMDVARRAQSELMRYAQMRGKPSAVVIGGAERSRSLTDALEVARATVVIGCVQRVRYREKVIEISLQGMDIPLEICIKKWQQALRGATARCVRQMLQSRNLGAGRVVIAMDVRLGPGGAIEIGAIGLMAVTKDWIPMESSHERDASDRLVAGGYRFTKDIFLPEGWELRPDFRLHLSSGRDFPLEVHGLSTPEYRERKRTTGIWLEQHFPGHHATWDVARGEAFPALPPP